MTKTLSLLGAVLAVGLFATGCAGPEKKLGRGINNMAEVIRWGELRRSREYAGVWQGPAGANGSGLVSGFNRSMARIGVGLYEVVTFPIPSYDPVMTHYLSPTPVYPDSYKPGLPDDAIFATDTYLGFSGGDLAPIVPGSRFSVFKTP
jgi:putative exosortase-associated protein (TIGR04073 family)